MIKHTLQEWCDFLGVYAVKNNFREDGIRPSFFTPHDITLFIHRPEIVQQNRAKPCYVDVAPDAWFGSNKISDVITQRLYFLISDLEELEDFKIYEPADVGTDKPTIPPEKEMPGKQQPATRKSYELERARMWSQDAATADRRTIHGLR